jgi:hypothetical protein
MALFHAVSSNRIKHLIHFSSPDLTALMPIKVRLFFVSHYSLNLSGGRVIMWTTEIHTASGTNKPNPKPEILNLLRPGVAVNFYQITGCHVINEVKLLKLNGSSLKLLLNYYWKKVHT